MTSPAVDLSAFAIRALHTPRPAEPDHVARNRVICEAVAAALGLPAGLTLDAAVNYATLSYGGGAAATSAVEYRVRVLGFAFGKGAKKHLEYLGVSLVGLGRDGAIVGWSEDIQAIGDGQREWRAEQQGLAPPPPRSNPRDCGLLCFVSGQTPAPLTDEVRALVARHAPPAAPAKKAKAKK
jgi:hypothetical protein